MIGTATGVKAQTLVKTILILLCLICKTQTAGGIQGLTSEMKIIFILIYSYSFIKTNLKKNTCTIVWFDLQLIPLKKYVLLSEYDRNLGHYSIIRPYTLLESVYYNKILFSFLRKFKLNIETL